MAAVQAAICPKGPRQLPNRSISDQDRRLICFLLVLTSIGRPFVHDALHCRILYRLAVQPSTKTSQPFAYFPVGIAAERRVKHVLFSKTLCGGSPLSSKTHLPPRRILAGTGCSFRSPSSQKFKHHGRTFISAASEFLSPHGDSTASR